MVVVRSNAVCIHKHMFNQPKQRRRKNLQLLPNLLIAPIWRFGLLRFASCFTNVQEELQVFSVLSHYCIGQNNNLVTKNPLQPKKKERKNILCLLRNIFLLLFENYKSSWHKYSRSIEEFRGGMVNLWHPCQRWHTTTFSVTRQHSPTPNNYSESMPHSRTIFRG